MAVVEQREEELFKIRFLLHAEAPLATRRGGDDDAAAPPLCWTEEGTRVGERLVSVTAAAAVEARAAGAAFLAAVAAVLRRLCAWFEP